MIQKKTIFWDVDTQYDFMDLHGKLHIPGSEKIIDTVSDVRRFAIENGFSLIASTDYHTPLSPEFSSEPDFKTTFPPHCIAGELGSERVGYLGNVPIEYIPMQKLSTQHLAEIFDCRQFHVVIRKKSMNVFENPNTKQILRLVNPHTIFVFGVALDVSVEFTISNLRGFVDGDVIVIEDAVKGMGIYDDAHLLSKLKDTGVQTTTLAELSKTFYVAP